MSFYSNSRALGLGLNVDSPAPQDHVVVDISAPEARDAALLPPLLPPLVDTRGTFTASKPAPSISFRKTSMPTLTSGRTPRAQPPGDRRRSIARQSAIAQSSLYMQSAKRTRVRLVTIVLRAAVVQVVVPVDVPHFHETVETVGPDVAFHRLYDLVHAVGRGNVHATRRETVLREPPQRHGRQSRGPRAELQDSPAAEERVEARAGGGRGPTGTAVRRGDVFPRPARPGAHPAR
ncbi:hypothetical protein THAOC_26295 [Thalassiosira oceanica]|uniref:Uncharacterized protein n=1 Tax=Thalassiosira oceanica TaxID=159749 RepID=K0S5J3_THAOC|nr:hypothetical protein THAOC_26295 [Thalassiosira oceanica]|eukprot:EJK54142.1 hypothetical protein THAOC_26295 [Thalassiosira oceanica]